MAADRIRALTAPHPIKPTSTRCQSAWRPNPGRSSTYRRGKSVQITGTSSLSAPELVSSCRQHNIQSRWPKDGHIWDRKDHVTTTEKMLIAVFRNLDRLDHL